MVVVADTSPINYLILNRADRPSRAYGRILIPPAVLAELKHPVAPKPVRDWADSAPKWVEVLSPKSRLILAQLDLGESEAIALATEVHAEVVLTDEQAGRQEALRRGLKVAARSRFWMKPIGLDSSFSMTRLLNCERPASACRRPSYRRSGKNDLTDDGYSSYRRLRLAERVSQVEAGT